MAMQSKSEAAAWLRLQLTPGIGNASMRRLLAAFSLPQNIFQQGYTALNQVVSAKQAQALLREPENYQASLAQLASWLEQAGQRLICVGDASYPQSLLLSPDPPLLLYVQCADPSWWASWVNQVQAPLLGMIGSRNPTPQGLRVAKEWAQDLTQKGYSVVSGLALGVDAAAHEGALLAPHWQRGRSIAVVGTGLDLVYPKQHAALAQNILDAGGAIISEYPLGTPAMAANFPKRNRIIAGLGLGVLVVEAALQSGSLITARLAMEANREVFALPGSIYAPQYKGCHALIKQGAQLVEAPEDILQALPDMLDLKDEYAIKKIATQAGFPTKNTKNTPQNTQKSSNQAQTQGRDDQEIWASPEEGVNTDAEIALLLAMGFDPIHPDLLLANGNWSAAQLQIMLFNLELSGGAQRLAGGYYQRLA
jgi:DNA processing protein